MSESLIVEVLSLILTFIVGLIFNKPGYKKGKNIANTLVKSFEDDKLTAEELQTLYDLIKSKAKK